MASSSHSRSSSTSSSTSKRAYSPEASPSKQTNISKKSKTKVGMSEIEKLTNLIEGMKIQQQKDSHDRKLEFDVLNLMITDLTTTVTGIRNDVASVITRVEDIEAQLHETRTWVIGVQNESTALRADLNGMEQAMQATSFNVFGLPNINRKDAFNCFEAICTKLNVKVEEKDLRELYVVNHMSKRTSHISGSFYDERKKIELMRRQKTARANENPVLVDDILSDLDTNHPLRGTEISIRNRLTQATQNLLNVALSYWDKYEFIWESNGKVMMRHTENSKPIEIKSQQHLENVAGLPSKAGSRRPKTPKQVPLRTRKQIRAAQKTSTTHEPME